MPLYFEHVALDWIKYRCISCGPAKNCLILLALDCLNIIVIDSLEPERDVLQGVENLDAPAALELVHEGS